MTSYFFILLSIFYHRTVAAVAASEEAPAMLGGVATGQQVVRQLHWMMVMMVL
jgi:hypothetical protein